MTPSLSAKIPKFCNKINKWRIFCAANCASFCVSLYGDSMRGEILLLKYLGG